MTDKEKIRAEIERLKKRAEHNFDISLTENERQFWLGESNVLTLIGKHIDSMQEEPTIPDIVDEHYWEMLGEEPVSEDLLKELKGIVNIRECVTQGVPVIKIACHFANWQKEQLIKDAVVCGGDGWFIDNKRNCRKNGKFHKYYQSTITHDKPLMMDGGTKYKLIIIKEDKQ